MWRRARPAGAEPRDPPFTRPGDRVRRSIPRRCDVGLRRPFSDTTPTRYERELTNVYVARNRMRAQRACLGIREKTRGGGTRALEDIDKIIPIPLRPSRRSRLFLPLPFLYSAPSRPRACYSGVSQAPLWHVSRVSLSLSFSAPFPPTRAGSPTARKVASGWLEGKRIRREEGEGERGASGSRPDRHSRNDFVLRACLIMNPHPGEAPPPFARRTTTSSSSPRGSSRGVGYREGEESAVEKEVAVAGS